MKNNISDVTRLHIADEMQLNKIWYHGKLSEPDFLARFFNLKEMHSNDNRYDNAYDDIRQHVVNNNDWEIDWLYTDPRINLLHCNDELYLRIISMTLHPIVRTKAEEVAFLLQIINKHLSGDGFEIVQTEEISGKPVYSGRQIVIGQTHLAVKKAEIKKYFDSAYVHGKINMMNDAVYKDTEIAIGTAKELLETTCKSILNGKGLAYDKDWNLPQLLKNTTSSLDFTPKETNDPEAAERAIRQILGGITSIVHGVAELRNSYGTGHGKDVDFKGLETKYAKLFVGVVSEIAILFLTTNGESTELIEIEEI